MFLKSFIIFLKIILKVLKQVLKNCRSKTKFSKLFYICLPLRTYLIFKF